MPAINHERVSVSRWNGKTDLIHADWPFLVLVWLPFFFHLTVARYTFIFNGFSIRTFQIKCITFFFTIFKRFRGFPFDCKMEMHGQFKSVHNILAGSIVQPFVVIGRCGMMVCWSGGCLSERLGHWSYFERFLYRGLRLTRNLRNIDLNL